MRGLRISSTLMAALLALATVAMAQEGTSAADRERILSHASYGVGFQMGMNLHQQRVEFDLEQVFQGIRDGVAGKQPGIDPQVLQTAMQELQTLIQEEQQAAGSGNAEEAEAFLAENGQREGVATTASGLQYEVIREGVGPKPSASDKVKVHYTGTLLDGTKFDSSVDRGQPAVFSLNGVIAAWTEGLQLMRVGAKWKLFVPPDLGYGAQGQGPIGPNSALIFEVELLGIEGRE